MNLVQINERLKDLPMQVIQQYANGMNPEVPPYLALGELQRRETAQKQMATAQGGMSGPQQSIKEQIEQKSGLMAAQGLQQQQMMQQMSQPRGPMPTSEGTPQPEAQPEMAMANGGLAAVPMRRDMFDYAGGGIVAFAEGESVEDPRRERKEGENFADFRNRMFALDLQLQREKNATEGAARESERQRRLAARGEDFQVPPSPFMDRPALPTPAREQVITSQGPDAPVVPRRPIEAAGLPAALQKTAPAAPIGRPAENGLQASAALPRPPAPASNPGPQAGLAAAAQSNVSPYMEKLANMIATPPVAPTEEGAIESMNKLAPAAMQEAAMQKRIEDQRARAEQERSAYDKSRPSGLDELIRVFGQSGQYKGLSGMAPAYTAMKQQNRAEDLAMEKRQNELLTAIEGRDYEGAKEMFGARTKAFDTAKQLFGSEKASAVKAAGDLAQVDQGRINNEMKMLSEEKMKKLELASRAADRAQQGAGLALKTDYLAKMAKSRLLAESGEAAASAKLAAEAADILMISGQTPSSGNADRIRGLQTVVNSMDADPQDKAAAIRELMALTKAAQPSAKPITEAEYKQLPKGATYTAPDGSQRTKG